MIRILLINPFQQRLVSKRGRIYNRTWPPLDLANAAALLEREAFDVSILDANAEQISPHEVAKRAVGFDKVFITSTSLDRWQCPQLDIQPFLETVGALKSVNSEVYVAGSHGTIKPVEMLSLTGARAIIRGEPELTILQLCKCHKLNEVKGITYHNGTRMISNINQTPVNLPDLPIPAFHLLPMNHYSYEVMGNHFCLFEMSRGCASECTFCLRDPYGDGVRKKHAEQVMKEVEHAINQFKVRTGYFIDLEFTVFRKQVIRLCKELIKANYDFIWCCQTRFDLVDDELLNYMKRAGCRLIHFGVEAGSDRMLELVNKGISIQKIREGMQKVKSAGIATACFFLMGLPESDKQDIADVVTFARELNPDFPIFHVAVPYPGTKIHEQVSNSTHIHFSDDTLFPEAMIGRFSLQDLRAITRKAYLQYYTQPSYILSRLLKGQYRVLFRQLKLFWAFVMS